MAMTMVHSEQAKEAEMKESYFCHEPISGYARETPPEGALAAILAGGLEIQRLATMVQEVKA
jgi:hypothetical protein